MIHWWRMNQVSSSLEKSTFFIHSYKFPNGTVTLFINSVWNQEGKTKITSMCLTGRLTGITLGSVRNNNCTAYRVEKFNLTPVFFSVRQIWKLPSIKSEKMNTTRWVHVIESAFYTVLIKSLNQIYCLVHTYVTAVTARNAQNAIFNMPDVSLTWQYIT